MPKLRISTEPHAGLELQLGNNCIVGRGSSADVPIDYPGVSRKHARIFTEGDNWFVEDLGSSNGTQVNGSPVHRAVALEDGAQIHFGTLLSTFRLTADEQARDQEGIDDRSLEVLKSFEPERVEQQLDPDKAETEEALRAVSKRLKLVNEVGAALAEATHEEAVYDLILVRLLDILPQAAGASIMIPTDDGEFTRRASRTRDDGKSEVKVSRTMLRKAIESRQAFVSIDASQDERFAASETVQNLGISTVICAPMLAVDRIVGAIWIQGKTGAVTFTDDDMTLVMGIARQSAVAVSNLSMHKSLLKRQLIEQDLAFARKVQANFLPSSSPVREGWDIWSSYEAALDVGGDYYDFLPLKDGRMAIFIGDASGKGISAALYMAKASSEIKYASAISETPGEVMARANQRLAEEIEEGLFMTAILIAVDLDSGKIEIVNAGHPPPMVRGRDGSVRPLESPASTALGVIEDMDYESAIHELTSGDVVFLYTDGVTEAMNPAQEEFGEEKLLRTLEGAAGSASELGAAIEQAVRAFYAGASQNDDLTLVSFSLL